MDKEKEFKHRQLPDGTWDSTCIKCYAIVGNMGDEKNLAYLEERHVCFASQNYIHYKQVG